MNLQTYLTQEVKRQRVANFNRSDQLSLGELIEKLETIAARDATREDSQHEHEVVFDFEYMFPTGLDSWRGSYDELALNSGTYYDHKDSKPMTVTAFLNLCRETVGKVFTGYKGGEYRMDRDTPIWVANYGNSGNTALIEVVDDGYNAILITGYREF